MWCESDIERLKILKDINEKSLGSSVLFCPDCDFQYAPGIAGKNECPICKSKLHIVTVDEELLELLGIE